MRINTGELGTDDLEVIVSLSALSQSSCRLTSAERKSARTQLKAPNLQGIVIPKVNVIEDVLKVDKAIEEHALDETKDSLRIVASIESPLAVLNLREVRRRVSFDRDDSIDTFGPDCYLFRQSGLAFGGLNRKR